MDDVPLADLAAQLGAERLVRVGCDLVLVFDRQHGGLGLFGAVDLEGLVHGAIGLGVDGLGHRVEHRIEIDLGAVLGDDVQGFVLGGVDRLLVAGQNVAGLRLIVFGGLLGCGRPVHVVAICLRH